MTGCEELSELRVVAFLLICIVVRFAAYKQIWVLRYWIFPTPGFMQLYKGLQLLYTLLYKFAVFEVTLLLQKLRACCSWEMCYWKSTLDPMYLETPILADLFSASTCKEEWCSWPCRYTLQCGVEKIGLWMWSTQFSNSYGLRSISRRRVHLYSATVSDSSSGNRVEKTYEWYSWKECIIISTNTRKKADELHIDHNADNVCGRSVI